MSKAWLYHSLTRRKRRVDQIPTMNDNAPTIPPELLKYLADAEFEIVEWNATRLAIRVTKEIGAEQGLLEFVQASLVSMCYWMPVASIRIGSHGDLPFDFFQTFRPGDKTLDPSETLFVIQGAWGERCLVIATGISIQSSVDLSRHSCRSHAPSRCPHVHCRRLL